MVLPVEGAPLVFSTGFAHDLVLHLNYPAGAKPDAAEKQDIPLTADAFRGGLALASIPKRHAAAEPGGQSLSSPPRLSMRATPLRRMDRRPRMRALPDTTAGAELTGTVEGFWGFEPYTGPDHAPAGDSRARTGSSPIAIR